MNNLENNRLIAQFMGFEITDTKVVLPEKYLNEDNPFEILNWVDEMREFDNLPPNSLNNICFDKDWNWIMKVVEEIESIFNDSYNVSIVMDSENLTTITVHFRQLDPTKQRKIKQFTHKSNSKLNSLFIAITEFIKWYNENN